MEPQESTTANDAILAAALQQEEAGQTTGQTEVDADRSARQLQQDIECQNDAALAAALAQSEAQEALANEQCTPKYPEILAYGGRDQLLTSRLSRLPSVKLTPQINAQIPGPSATNADRDRLLLRLEQYSLTERVVKGDGACQFRSLSDQLYGVPDHHDVVREKVVSHMRANPGRYAQHVPQDFEQYCRSMSNQSTWGDHITLQAAADCYGIRIIILTSFKENSVLAIEPVEKRSSRVVWLSFWAEVHYNSIYPQEEPPPVIKEVKILGSKTLGRLLAE